ncbi:hypothetical protein [uncultured Flavobacterium sp.]|uniref:hypothetical protein n=1 Tax=uncultured Flavobacterium sp. TaxID=165435 RepID=UPI0025E1E60B|nr:hypothetical protein [uncultured Flavobacterium sp.]
MPSTIPYDPSLVLGNIVNQDRLDNLLAISAAQAPADAAEDNLNSLITLKRSLDMTVQELIEMNVDATDVIQESQDVGTQIAEAAKDFGKAKVASEKAIQPLKAKMRGLSESVESPVDWNKTQIKQMPLSSDSLKMNCQYFAFDENTQNSDTHAATIAAFVSDSTSVLGDDYSAQAKTSAQSQVNSQHQNHSISGTLVVTITCTHKDAVLLAPFIMDVDKSVRVWNKLFADDMIKINDPSSIMQIMQQQDTTKEKSFTLLSGETCGSCFIGMVHTLNVTDTKTTETMYSIAESIQGQFSIGCWFGHESGGFGVDSSFSNDAKNLLSSQSITSHCTLTVMGSLPSIKSNTVMMAVQSFTDFDGASSMKAVQTLQNATANEIDTIDSAASSARTGGQLVSMKAAQVTSTLSGLSTIDNQNNKMIDTNSLMDAMEDYLNKCLAGNIGVPINFYLKPITKSQIAQMWLAKYYPNRWNLAGAGDDSAPAQQAQPAAQPAS